MQYVVKARKLARRGYCLTQVEKFKQVFPDGAAFTLKNLLHAQREGLNVLHVFDCANTSMRRHYKHNYTTPLSKKIGWYNTLIAHWPIVYAWSSYAPPVVKSSWRSRAKAERTLKLLWQDKLLRRFLREEIAVREK